MRRVLFCSFATFAPFLVARTASGPETPLRIRHGGSAAQLSPPPWRTAIARRSLDSAAGLAMWLYKSTSRGSRRSSEAQPTQLAGAPGSPPRPVPWVAGEITDLQSINQALIDATSVRTSNASTRSSMQSLNEASTKSRRGSAASVAAHAVRRSSMMLDDAARKGSVNIAAGQGVLRF